MNEHERYRLERVAPCPLAQLELAYQLSAIAEDDGDLTLIAVCDQLIARLQAEARQQRTEESPMTGSPDETDFELDSFDADFVAG